MQRASMRWAVVLSTAALLCPVLWGPSRSTVHAQTAPGRKAEAGSRPIASWPQFRGPNAAGVAQDSELPVEFSPTKNVVWKTAVPPGHSSPCVWGDNIFLTAFKQSTQLVVLCVRASDGRIRWESEVEAGRIETTHPRVGSPASSSPATDGRRVYAFFGSVGVICFDFEGRQVWRRKLGPLAYDMGWGAGSSPILYGDSVIQNCDHDGESFLVALDKETGRERWRTARPWAPASYSTPILWDVGGRTRLIVAGTGRLTAYDAETGREIWYVRQPESFAVTTPVASRELLFAAAVDRNSATGDFSRSVEAKREPNFDLMFANHDGNRDGKIGRNEVPMMRENFDRIDTDGDGFLTREELEAEFRRQQQMGPPPSEPRESGNVLMAIRPGGRGDVTETHVAWRVLRTAPYVPSPLRYGDYLYLVRGGGIVSCFTSATGKLAWRQRVAAPGNYYASPVAGDGKLFLVSDSGEVSVLAAGRQPRLLSRNPMNETSLATPAIAGGKIYIRTESNLYCIGEQQR